MTDKFKHWNYLEKLSSLWVLFLWFLRGVSRRVFFRQSKGLVLIGKGSVIRNPYNLSVGRDFVMESFAELNCISTGRITFGDRCTIGRQAIIRPSNIYGGSKGVGLQVGNHSNIGPYAYIGCSGKITIGDHVMMGPRVSLFAENHHFGDNEKSIKEQGVELGEIIIEDNCWIASNVTILSNVVIGTGSVVGAGSVVTKSIPANSIVAGNPARVIKTR